VAKRTGRNARIAVLAGVNGAGKSSVAGAMVRDSGGEYWNPDEAARKILERNPSLSIVEANSLAWQEGVKRLRSAIESGADFTFETTLGGETIPSLLAEAARAGAEVRVWFAGLANVDLHLSRIESRVKAGGHHVPEAVVRRRYQSSRLNLIRLLPDLAELRVFDNSSDADPRQGATPRPVLLLHMKEGRVVEPKDFRKTPDWAKPIVAAALRKA